LVVVLAIFGLTFFNRHKNPTLSDDGLIITVSRQLNITGDPNPAVLTVVNKEKTNQPFLNDSKDGDKVLLYYKAHKSVLFRPVENKIIKSGSYTPPAAKIQVRQGTTNVKHVNDILALLKAVPNTTISTQDASVKSDYSETLVIDVSNRYTTEITDVAKAIKGQVRSIPQSESVPDADILVIVGSN